MGASSSMLISGDPRMRFPYSSLWKSGLLLLSRFSRVRLCATPKTAAHQAPPSLGFSRQEHWSGLPFPSPMHESEKWKWSRSVVRLLVTPWTAAYQIPMSMGFSRQEYRNGLPLPSPENLGLALTSWVAWSKSQPLRLRFNVFIWIMEITTPVLISSGVTSRSN